MPIKHAFVNPQSDGPDTTIARPSDWNADHTGLAPGTIVAVFDGGSAAITGNPEVDVVVPDGGTLTSYTLLADASGSAVIDVWRDTYANYPPTDADSITASAPPTLSSAIKATDSTLTGWSKTVTAGDIFRFHVDSSTTVKRLVLTLTYTRS
jgi:hypothetical protein